MPVEEDLRDKLRKVEALFAGAKTPGERRAAELARDRLRAKLGEPPLREPKFDENEPNSIWTLTIDNEWHRQLLSALCEKYGVVQSRKPRQSVSTVNVQGRSGAIGALREEFSRLGYDLSRCLTAMTTEFLAKEVHRRAGK